MIGALQPRTRRLPNLSTAAVLTIQAMRALSFSRVAARDLLRVRNRASPAVHVEAAASWLKAAQDATPDAGVSYGYSLRGGWRPSYRETSGYIAPTFFDLARRSGGGEFAERAVAICRWLCSVQNADGSISNPRFDPDRGVVFDTGQVLLGLVRAYEETAESLFLDAAERAGEWLVKIADPDGCWTRNTYLGTPHVYNTRTAWALLRLNTASPSASLERVARANLDWAIAQESGGWFEQCGFEPGVPPYTHNIAYAIRGLLESGLLLEDSAYLEAAFRSGEAVTRHVRADGFIPAQIDSRGNPRARYCCLTGNCQLAIIWAKLHEQSQDDRYRRSAAATLRFVMDRQDIHTSNPNLRGAIKGSHPVWGGYSCFTFPNWSTKFFVDAILLCERWVS
jgi:uncharacterized protein YyaL (SSP411 family)